jgi:hypothetical protein
MWEPQPLTTLRASKACRGENFTFTFLPYADIIHGIFLFNDDIYSESTLILTTIAVK